MKRKLHNAAPKRPETWWSLSIEERENKKNIVYLHHWISIPPETLLSFIRWWKLNDCWSKTNGETYHTLHIHQYHQELKLSYCSYFSCFSSHFSSSFLFVLMLSTRHQISSPFLYQDWKVPSKPQAETLPVCIEATVSMCATEITTRHLVTKVSSCSVCCSINSPKEYKTETHDVLLTPQLVNIQSRNRWNSSLFLLHGCKFVPEHASRIAVNCRTAVALH